MSHTHPLATVVSGRTLSADTMEAAMDAIMSGVADPIRSAGLLAAMATRGETIEEVTGAARSMRRASKPFPSPFADQSVDTCGTGGDGAGTFNISTAASFVAAASGLRVAKHGNRAVSSKAGSADVLEALGAQLDISPEAMADVQGVTGYAFLFAPTYHPAMRHAMPIRRSLKVRTIFNLLGPISNPARTAFQVIGVFDQPWLRLADVLANLGSKRVMVVHGADGLDEFSLSGPTFVRELKPDGTLDSYLVSPGDVGLAMCGPDDLRGGNAAENAATLRRIFTAGADAGPIARAVQFNAGAAIYIAGGAETLADGVGLAGEVIASGAALRVVDDFVGETQRRRQ